MYALLGGSFDPVHHGHLRAALDAAEYLGCRVHLTPTGTPVHRAAPLATAAQRLAMLEVAVVDVELLAVDARETRPGGPRYSVDTLTALRAELGAAEPIVLLLGLDAFAGLASWRRWRDLFSLAHLGVLTRPGYAPEFEPEVAGEWFARRVTAPGALADRPAGMVLPIEVTSLTLASTDLRARCARGQALHFLTPPAVVRYIAEHGLYASPDQVAGKTKRQGVV